MAKRETKLGPTATYHDLGGDAPVVTVGGVTFEDGEAVNVVDEIGEGRAEQMLAKLAGNQYFDVEGSDADHEDVRDRIARESNNSRRKTAKAKPAPAVKKAVAKRLAKEDADDDAVGRQAPAKPPATADDDNGTVNETTGEQLPDDVKTPSAPTLESSRPRLPRARN